MKHVFLLSIIGILVAFLPAILWAPTTSAPLPSPTPSIRTDESISFTVQTETGTETTNLADYLPGVLAGEMPALFETQALMAQAVAARTYILHCMESPSAAHPDADICNDPACCKAYATEAALRENWGSNYDSYWSRITNAVQATDGQHLTYEGEPIEAVFHSSSKGTTESSEAIWNPRPYLVSVESPETTADVQNLVTEVIFSAEELKTVLTSNFPTLTLSAAPAQWFSQIKHTDSGRVDTVSVCGTVLKGTQLRSALGLRSSAFTVDFADNAFTFTVSGYGHGVGMSQYGANVYAKQGWSYEEILAHYYPGTQLTSAAG